MKATDYATAGLGAAEKAPSRTARHATYGKAAVAITAQKAATSTMTARLTRSANGTKQVCLSAPERPTMRCTAAYAHDVTATSPKTTNATALPAIGSTRILASAGLFGAETEPTGHAKHAAEGSAERREAPKVCRKLIYNGLCASR